MRVLVADDSEMYRMMLKTLLEERGYEVVTVANGLDALAILESEDVPRLAILNCFMPGLGGLELCQKIRSRKHEYVYTILLSAADHENDVLRGFEYGADDYLCKPFKEAELIARVRVGERVVLSHQAIIKENQELRIEASQDSLLQIWNRRAIFALLNTELSRSKRMKTPLSVFLIDLDFFKRVNDTYGHLVGDEVLLGVTRELSRAVREYDHVGRCGGEEFLVVLPDCTAEAALEVAERVRQEIGDGPILVGNLQVNVTVSIGLSQWHPGQELPDLLRQADVAMYRAKQNGRDRVEVEGTVLEGKVEKHEKMPNLAGSSTYGIPLRKRLEIRHPIALPVRIWGLDATGQLFEQYATTVDVTTTGAFLTGITHQLQRGCVIGLEHRASRARYRVTWVESSQDNKPGKVGVQLIEIGKFIWGRVVPRVFTDDPASGQHVLSD